MDDKLTLFIAITASAVVLQMLILAGMFFAVRKIAAGVKTATDEVQTRLVPVLENVKTLQADVKGLLETSRPKVDLILDNAAAITTTAHSGLGRFDTTMNDILDRARLQVIRADEMMTRTMDKVEDTTERVAHTVVSPVKHANGLVQGISAGFGALFGHKRPRNGGPSDEMFI